MSKHYKHLPKRERWTLDIMKKRRRFHILSIIDIYSRECLWQPVDLSIPSIRVKRLLKALIECRGKPRQIIYDHGPEFTSQCLQQWTQRNHISLPFIQPGRPIQNAFSEIFQGDYRDGCLNIHCFLHETKPAGGLPHGAIITIANDHTVS